MRILGIDPGTGIIGFGCISVRNNKRSLEGGGVLRFKSSQPLAERLEGIYDELTLLIKEMQPDAVSVEKLFFAQNVTTAMSVSHARGVILLTAQQAGLPIFEYTPLQIKHTLTGYGRATKSQMQEMVKILLRMDSIPKPDDCADALAAAICHEMHSGAAYQVATPTATS